MIITYGRYSSIYYSKLDNTVIKHIKDNYIHSAEWFKECIISEYLCNKNNYGLLMPVKEILKNNKKEIYGIKMPYYKYTLDSYLLDIDNNLTEKDFMMIFYRLVLGLKILHTNKIIHADIKYENIFLNNINDICIGDFDNCVFYDIKLSSNNNLFDRFIDINSNLQTIFFRAPEITAGKNYSNKIDIWSLGIICKKIYKWENKMFKNIIDEMFEKLINNNFKFINFKVEIINLLDFQSENTNDIIIDNKQSKIIMKYIKSREVPYQILALAIEYMEKFIKLSHLKFTEDIFTKCLSFAEKIHGFSSYDDSMEFTFCPYFLTKYDKMIINNPSLTENNCLKFLKNTYLSVKT